MQINEKINDGLKREYNIVVPAATVEEKIQTRLQDLSKHVKIPGFRPGKVPVSVVSTRYEPSVRQEVIESLIEEGMLKLIQDKNVKPAMRPKVSMESKAENKDLVFNVNVEVLPEVTFPDLSSLSLVRYTIDVTDKEVEEGLERIAAGRKKFEANADIAKTELGHAVEIDFEGRIDGVAFEGGAAKDYRLELGSKQFIDGFEDQLVGARPGEERLVKVKFPENYGSEHLAGKPAEFTVKIKQILVAQKPEINDAFAQEFGLENLNKLKEVLKEQIANEYKEATYNFTKKSLFDELEKRCEFPIPESMVDAEFNVIWDDMLRQRAREPEDYGKSEDELRQDFKRVAQRRVRLGIFLAEFGQANNVKVEQGELRDAIYHQARSFPGQEHKVVEYYSKNADAMEQLKGPILERKVVDFIMDKVQITEKPISAEDFVKLRDESEA